MKLPPEKFLTQEEKKNSKEEALTEPKKFILNSADELFAELRDKNFNAVGTIVSRKAKTITAEFDVLLHLLLFDCKVLFDFSEN